jgi:hypothetical protein
MERIKREILQSKCFDTCKKEYPNFMQMFDEKIEPIEGDIVFNIKRLFKFGIGGTIVDFQLIKESTTDLRGSDYH